MASVVSGAESRAIGSESIASTEAEQGKIAKSMSVATPSASRSSDVGLGVGDIPNSDILAEVKLETETGSPSRDENSAPLSTISTGAIFPPGLIPGAAGDDSSGQARKEFETISLEEQKKPRRIIHFSDGVLEEYSTDEEDGGEEEKLMQPSVDPKTLDWLPYIWHYMVAASFATYRACDFMGEKLAYFFGITSPKYAYAISEYNRLEAEEKEELDRQMAEREEQRERVAMQTAEEVNRKAMMNQPEPGLPTSTH
ncbi:uncharacterized protein [Diadema setosum]|uniref:uncharacterized protein n=1 Tax=Diadema setosum TaxID=31175 RepID=UPI003B3B039F